MQYPVRTFLRRFEHKKSYWIREPLLPPGSEATQFRVHQSRRNRVNYNPGGRLRGIFVGCKIRWFENLCEGEVGGEERRYREGEDVE